MINVIATTLFIIYSGTTLFRAGMGFNRKMAITIHRLSTWKKRGDQSDVRVQVSPLLKLCVKNLLARGLNKL